MKEGNALGKRKKLQECGVHNDIRFRGPLSYPVFQMLGWMCIAVTVAATIIRFAVRFETPVKNTLMDAYMYVSLVGMLSLPLLLIANFARILNNSEGYKKQLMRTGFSMLGVAGAFIFVFYRYAIGGIGLISTDPKEVLPTVMETIRKVQYKGCIPFNIFVDLFLCTVFMYFINARPKKYFTGKKLYIFRAFGILPIAYEAASMIIKANCASGALKLPAWAYPFLTVKPPMTFVVFMVLAAYIKIRELRFCRGGRTYGEYQEFLGTNRNSRDFAIFTTIVLIAAGFLDALLLNMMMGATTEYAVPLSIGVGDATMQIFVAPLVLLFSYTRVPKNKTIGMLIPAAGMALILLVILQGAYQMLKVLNIPKIDMAQLRMALEAAFTPVQ